jgi:hypothetical protein
MSANVPIASISIAPILPWEFEERVFKPEMAATAFQSEDQDCF